MIKQFRYQQVIRIQKVLAVAVIRNGNQFVTILLTVVRYDMYKITVPKTANR